MRVNGACKGIGQLLPALGKIRVDYGTLKLAPLNHGEDQQSGVEL